MKRLALESIEGVEIYPIISLVIFVGLFSAAMLYTFRMDNSFVKKMADLPLGKDELNLNKTGNETE